MKLPGHRCLGNNENTPSGQKWLLSTLLVLAVCLGSCGDLSLQKSKKPSSPNVLVITLDTTRADRLGCYGYEAAETPVLDALAARGVKFREAYTPAPMTLTAQRGSPRS